MRRLPIRILVYLSVVYLFAPVQLKAQNSSAPPNFNGFESFVEQVMKDWHVPGLAVAVVKDGKVAYTKGFGYRKEQS